MKMNDKSIFLEKIRKFAHSKKLWTQNDKILLAVSGGPDSLGLLLAMNELQKTENFSIGCCTIDHHLRKESAQEVIYVNNVCKELGIKCKVIDINVKKRQEETGQSCETAARQLRYQALQDTFFQGNYTKIALAHHEGDQAETVIHRFIRGGGMTGLSGILPKREFFIRPFLSVTKKEIQDYIENFPYIPAHDKTNDIPDVTRNKIRLQLIPELKKYNPNIVETICRTAYILQDEDSFLCEETLKFVENNVKREKTKILLNRVELIKIHVALQRRVIRYIFSKLINETYTLDYNSVERFRKLIILGNTGNITSASNMMLKIEKKKCIFYIGNTRNNKVDKNINEFECKYKKYIKNIFLNPTNADIMRGCLAKSEKISELDDYHLYSYVTEYAPKVIFKNQYILDADKVGLLKLRYKNNGDVFEPNGIKGTQKLVKCMQSLKIASSDRNTLPLLADSDNIYWIPFYRGSRRARVNEKTTNFLVITLIKNEQEKDVEYVEK